MLITFLKTRFLENIILTRCNNMRAFYIETIRIFTTFNLQKFKDNYDRLKLTYYYIQGQHSMYVRKLI